MKQETEESLAAVLPFVICALEVARPGTGARSAPSSPETSRRCSPSPGPSLDVFPDASGNVVPHKNRLGRVRDDAPTAELRFLKEESGWAPAGSRAAGQQLPYAGRPQPPGPAQFPGKVFTSDHIK